VKRKLSIILVKDSKNQWRPAHAVRITSKENTYLEDQTALYLLTPTIAMTFESQRCAELLHKWNDVALPAGPSCCLDAQAFALQIL
jgi:hypothetical protein